MQDIISVLIQDFSNMQVFLSALIQGSVLCKNFQDLLVISASLRSVLFEAALFEALVYQQSMSGLCYVGVKILFLTSLHHSFKTKKGYSTDSNDV